MLLAVIGDAAGNFYALDAALNAIAAEGIQTVFHAGNMIVGEPWANETVERLQKSGVLCVQGDRDRGVARFQKKRRMLERRLDAINFETLRAAHELLQVGHLEWLQSLPRQRRLEIDGVSIFLCHGSPGAMNQSIAENTPLVKLERYREDTGCALVLCGGPAPAFSRQVADTLFVHPGPLAAARGRAEYTVVSTEQEPWTVETEAVAFDLP